MESVRARRLTGGLAVGAVLALAGSASGQAGAAEPRREMRQGDGGVVVEGAQPVVRATRRAPRESKIERYASVLGLDDTQREVARDLHSAHEQALSEAGKAMNAGMKDAQVELEEGAEAEFHEKLDKIMSEHGAKTKELTRQFLADLRTLLRPDQEANWPRLERLRRRESTLSSMMLGGGTLGGSNVDLIPLVGRLEVPEEVKPKVDELLSLYEVDIDRPLQDRERYREEDQEKMGAVRQFTPETFQKQQERDRAVDVRIREVNDKYVRLIATELPSELGTKLQDEYRTRSFRSAYRATSVGRELAAAEKLKGLSEKQREQIAAMHERYKREAKAANDRLAEAMRRAEEDGKTVAGSPMMMFGPDGQANVDSAITEARAAKRELDGKLRGEMEKLLTPEQLADARDAAKPHGVMGRQVHVMSDGMGEDMVLVSDMELEGDFEEGEGGHAVVIFQTVGTPALAPAPPPPPANPD